MSGSENQEVITPGIKITGTGEITKANPEEIAEMQKETAIEQPNIIETPQEIIDAANKIRGRSKFSATLGEVTTEIVDIEDIAGIDELAAKVEGEIEKAYTEEKADGVGETINGMPVREDPMPTISDKESFDPNSIADPRRGSDGNGGISSSGSNINKDDDSNVRDGELVGNKTTGMDGAGNGVNSNDLNTDSVKRRYEVTGFAVQYKRDDGISLASIKIRDYYDTIEEAEASVSGFTYTMKNQVKSKITLGAPTICFDERQIKDYVNDEWRRV